jgi:hypothetical protein
MNAEKWKSVVVPIDTYKVLKDMAHRNRRTISGQFTFVLENYQEGESQIYTAHGQQVISAAAKK